MIERGVFVHGMLVTPPIEQQKADDAPDEKNFSQQAPTVD